MGLGDDTVQEVSVLAEALFGDLSWTRSDVSAPLLRNVVCHLGRVADGFVLAVEAAHPPLPRELLVKALHIVGLPNGCQLVGFSPRVVALPIVALPITFSPRVVALPIVVGHRAQRRGLARWRTIGR
jgi:hypothetical protein